MTYHIEFTDKAFKELRKMDRVTQERIISALERIRFRPEDFVTKLVGFSAYKLRVGNYRVLVDIDRERVLILIIKVAHRKNVYKHLGSLEKSSDENGTIPNKVRREL